MAIEEWRRWKCRNEGGEDEDCGDGGVGGLGVRWQGEVGGASSLAIEEWREKDLGGRGVKMVGMGDAAWCR